MQSNDSERLTALTDSRRELAGRFLASAAIKKSRRLRELFTYLLEQTASGGREGLHEQQIGEKVFGKPPGYDTSVDNIVRANVFLLRKKLERYFGGEGAAEQEVIGIPRGRYAVEFHPRHGAAPVPHSPPPDEPAPVEARSAWRWWIPAAVAVPVVVGLLLLWSWPGPRRAGESPQPPEHWRLWRTMFTAEREAYVVVADIGLSLLQDLSGATIGLDQYLSRIDPKLFEDDRELPPRLVERLGGRQYTAVSNASIVFRLGAINSGLRGRAVIRAAQSINIRDLKTHNIVLLGSERSNPWVSLIKEKMGLRIEYEGSPPKGIVRNLKPGSGEPEVMKATAFAGNPGEAIGLLAYLPNLDNTGRIVSIAGTNMEGTEAAAEMLLEERLFRELARELRLESGAPVPYFEAVIRAASIGGAGLNPSVVLARRLQ
jgi:hypothetical protein